MRFRFFGNVLIFLAIPFQANSHNLIVDVSRNAILDYFSKMHSSFEVDISKWSLPSINYSKLLCSINLIKPQIRIHKFPNISGEIRDPVGDYYLSANNILFEIYGNYKRSFLFFSTINSYSINITASRISLGPLIPISHAGYPFLNSDINCNPKNITVSSANTNGWFVHSLIQNAVKEKIGSMICHKMVEILDSKIRKDIEFLQMNYPILDDSTYLNYEMFKFPLILESKNVRFFFDGTSETIDHSNTEFDIAPIRSNRHFTFYIHQNLISEFAETLCQKGYLDANFTSVKNSQNLFYTCFSANVVIRETLGSISLSLIITSIETYSNGTESKQDRIFMLNPLYNSDSQILIRLKSQLINETADNSFREQLFIHISKILSDNFLLPLPHIWHSTISNTRFTPSNPKFLVFSGNFQF